MSPYLRIHHDDHRILSEKSERSTVRRAQGQTSKGDNNKRVHSQIILDMFFTHHLGLQSILHRHLSTLHLCHYILCGRTKTLLGQHRAAAKTTNTEAHETYLLHHRCSLLL